MNMPLISTIDIPSNYIKPPCMDIHTMVFLLLVTHPHYIPIIHNFGSQYIVTIRSLVKPWESPQVCYHSIYSWLCGGGESA